MPVVHVEDLRLSATALQAARLILTAAIPELRALAGGLLVFNEWLENVISRLNNSQQGLVALGRFEHCNF